MNAEEQLEEVIRRFDLKRLISPFCRCLACNGATQPVKKEEILHVLKPKTGLCYESFFQCVECGKIYWKGSHFGRLSEVVRKFSP
jgi:uncharacterized protein